MIAPHIRRLFAGLKHTPLHPQWLVFRNAQLHKQHVAQHIQGCLLDIGCGEKPLMPFLDDAVEYIGLDYPPTVAKGYSGKADVFGDGQCLPFKDASFDSISILDVMEHLPNPEAAFREMVRVLKPGGILVSQTPFLYPLHDLPHDFQRWTGEGLRQFTARHSVDLIELTHYSKPMETAAVLANLAMIKGILESLRTKHPGALLLPLVVLLVPIVNLAGWLFARLLPDEGFMPLGYTAVFKKRA
ncbi:MAG: class I SAM-dependent methyltransferase [Halothiobacillaceae bacterium]